MNKHLFVRGVFLLLAVLWLAGCQITSDGVVPTTSMLSPIPAGTEITEPIMPGVWIKKGKPKVILDAVVRERLKRKMRVKAREVYALTMALTVPNTKKLTEAQMVYTLYRYQGGLWLSARVYQITEPRTPTESIVEVTLRVEKEIQQELNKIAEQFGR